jgi:hypothetical protein
MTQLALSSNGLSLIPQSAARNDFTFTVGDHRYLCPSYVADFISPRICRLHTSDVSINEFFVETSDPQNYFTQLLSLGSGAKIALNDDLRGFLCLIGREFENDELLELVCGPVSDDVTISNAFDRLRLLKESGRSTDKIDGFCAGHFAEFGPDFWTRLAYDDLERILSNKLLVLRGEDQLFRVIASRLPEDPSFFGLFHFVRFEYLSGDSVSEFSEMAVSHFEYFTVALWSAVIPRLAPTGSAPGNKRTVAIQVDGTGRALRPRPHRPRDSTSSSDDSRQRFVQPLSSSEPSEEDASEDYGDSH